MSDDFDDAGYFTFFVSHDENEAPIETPVSESFEEAQRIAADLVRKYPGRAVVLSENGYFTSNRKPKEDLLDIWWNDEWIEIVGREPKARGYGFYSPEVGRKRWVEYEPAPLTTSDDESEEDEADNDENYVKTHCNNCGPIMPLYKSYQYEFEQEVGRSSGAARFGQSSSRRSSNRNASSSTFGSHSSYSTGRTYYQKKTLDLCEECYGNRLREDNDNVNSFYLTIGKILFGITCTIALVCVIVAFAR